MVINIEEVQEYKDTSKMTNEEVIEYISKPRRSKSGIIVISSYNKNGLDFNTVLQNYFQKCLDGGV